MSLQWFLMTGTSVQFMLKFPSTLTWFQDDSLILIQTVLGNICTMYVLQMLETCCKSGAHWAEVISVSLELATHLLSCQTTFYTLRSANIIQNIADMHKRFNNISSTCLYICSILTVYSREFNTFEHKGIRHICCVYLVYI